MVSALSFFKEFIREPFQTGAFAPSSSGLAHIITESSNTPEGGCVVELGPGTGAITGKILERISPDQLFLAIESNPRFYAMTRKRFPGLHIYHDSAVNIRELLGNHGRTTCDTVISCIPWGHIDDLGQRKLLHEIRASLSAKGEFIHFAYIWSPLNPKFRKFERLLFATFPDIKKSRMVWSNLPPAYIYRCTK